MLKTKKLTAITLALVSMSMTIAPVSAETVTNETAYEAIAQESYDILDTVAKAVNTINLKSQNKTAKNTKVKTTKSETEPTLYDTLTEEEATMLATVIQHEVGNFSAEYKTYVAELLYNRLKSSEFPNTVKELLFAKNQFQGISKWLYSPKWTPTQETRDIIKKVFSEENPSHLCTYYYNPEFASASSIQWFEYSGDLQYIFSATETLGNKSYTTRFFMSARAYKAYIASLT